ncbi:MULTISPECIES: type III secretion protein [Mesorhizobium]|uniref:type III secretion protein n=1 Tax=Mesorhizobium TaxID=68287 RepID=UPI0015D03D6A|nr:MULTISPECIES: type III secretion protein [Mesorhizobium]
MDDIPSRGHNSIGSSVAMMGADDNIKVAVAVVMGAACCNQNAPLSAIVHAPHMAADEWSMTSSASVSMKQITDEGDEIPVKLGHIWNELRRGSRDPRSTVVMDAWANGPAVRLKDSAWSGVPVKEGHWSMDKSTAEFLKNRVEGLIPFVHPDTNEQTANDLRRKQNEPTSWKKYAEVQVISPEFADSVRNALSRIPEDQQKEIASRMIQEAYEVDPSSRTHQDAVESVLVAANQLDSLPRPPVEPPELAAYHQFVANQQTQAHAVPGMQDILPQMPPPQHAAEERNANLDGHIAGLEAEVRAAGAQISYEQLRRGGQVGQPISHAYNHAREDLMAASRSRDRSGR